jgi:hypothetical protein
MCKICWAIVAILGLILTGITYRYAIQGSTIESADGRTVVLLGQNERDFVLSEMRVFLESVQQITGGIHENDMHLVAEYARMEVPGSLIGKLPLSFKQMGFETHTRFDELALDAEQLGDRDHALSQMNALLWNCVACHATYRFGVTTHTPM